MIEVKDIIPKVQEALEKNNKKKFTQSLDLSVGFKNLDFKNPANAIDDVLTLPNGRGKQVKICALVDKEMQTAAKAACYKVIMADEFPTWKDSPKKMKKLADECDIFIAQASIMPKIAQTFGKIFGPRNKMPNPKAGAIVLPNAKLEAVVERLSKTIYVRAKKAPSLNVPVGSEKMDAKQVAENIFAVIDYLLRHLPAKDQNIKHVYVKTTMGEAVKVM